MKKSLLALAVFGAFAGVASAQSSVTMYGIVDTAVTRFDDGTGTTTGITSGQQSASRVGLKGTEDLGNGLKANFVLEGGFSADTGNAAGGFSRQANVGLQGGFGSVALGLNNNAMKRAVDKLDAFGNGGMAGLSNVYGTNERTSNSIHYVSPTFGGFSGAVTYGLGEVAGSNKAGRDISASGSYAAGPLGVHLAYNGYTDDFAGADENVKTAVLGASYDFGVAKLFASYIQKRVDAPSEFDIKGFNIGASAKVGTGTVLASATRLENDGTANDNEFDQYAIGYTHPLSKRTNLYATYARVTNDDLSARWSADEGDSGNRLALGVKHAF